MEKPDERKATIERTADEMNKYLVAFALASAAGVYAFTASATAATAVMGGLSAA